MVFDWEQFATTFVGEGAVDASLVALVRLKRSCSQNHAGVRRAQATKPARQMHQLVRGGPPVSRSDAWRFPKKAGQSYASIRWNF